MYVYINVCMYVCMCLCMYGWMYVCIYLCMYLCLYNFQAIINKNKYKFRNRNILKWEKGIISKKGNI